jgi:hypothetical protein
MKAIATYAASELDIENNRSSKRDGKFNKAHEYAGMFSHVMNMDSIALNIKTWD